MTLFQKEVEHVKSTYSENASSMLKYEYDCVYFIAQKPHASSAVSTNVNVCDASVESVNSSPVGQVVTSIVNAAMHKAGDCP